MCQLAERLAQHITPPCVICLDGAIGVGKSVFARAFIKAHGIAGEIPSPTFTLVQTYETDTVTIWHMDAYRIEREDDALELGILEAFESAIVLIEWPGKIASLLPGQRLDIFIRRGAGEDARLVEVEGSLAENLRL